MAVSKSQKLATNTYNSKNYQILSVRLKLGVRDRYHAEAEKRRMSLAEFVQHCIEKEIKSNKDKTS